MEQRWGLAGRGGFVGSSLRRQTSFAGTFGRDDLAQATRDSWDVFVCAAAPGEKWRANQEPEADRQAIDGIEAELRAVRAERFVLISTVDVLPSPTGCDEGAETRPSGLMPYAAHRLQLENFVREHFAQALIVRLAGLVGPGLKKNALFDLAHEHRVDAIRPDDTYQYYPMVNLAADIRVALGLGLTTLHLAAEPLSMGEVAEQCFGRTLDPAASERAPVRYDVRSRHAVALGGQGAYAYGKRESLLAIRAYAQSYRAMLAAKAEKAQHAAR